ncbi:MAG: SAM-dependent methyltransferase [Propylenella sp.]
MTSLTVVGTGIMFPSQMTMESAEAIRLADVVFYNVGAHPLAVEWIKENAKSSTNLYDMYAPGKDRSETYREMVDAIVGAVEEGKSVVAAFYGHPGVFVGPGFEAIQECRELGYEARMLPGVSAVDCMFADLEFDPAAYGCSMVEATDYVLSDRTLDTTMPLIVWQAGVVADLTFNVSGKSGNLDLLKERLLQDYPPDHPIVAYHAPTLPGMRPVVATGEIAKLEELRINASTTCLVRPLVVSQPSERFSAELTERMRESLAH